MSGQTSPLVHTKRGFGTSAVITAIVVGLAAAAAAATTLIALQNSVQTADSLNNGSGLIASVLSS